MKQHTRRQIELDDIWANINRGKYDGMIGPQKNHVGTGIDSMMIPMENAEDELYERRQNEGWKLIPFVGETTSSDIENAQPLKCQKAYWDAGRPDIISALKVPPEALNHADLVQLARELDRRFMQLHDKVEFERTNGLVDYKTLAGPKES